MRVAIAAWGVLAAGASGQAAIEFLAGGGLAARTTALGLTAVLMATNGTRRRYPQWIPIALCVTGLPLWVSHGVGVLSTYDPGAVAASALSPALLIVGTFLMHAEPPVR